jgi:hypothetical protein
MGLDKDGHSKILDDDGQDGGTKGSVVLDGPQGGTEAAKKSRGIDGCKDFLLDVLNVLYQPVMSFGHVTVGIFV